MLRVGRGWVAEVDGDVVGFAIVDLRDASVWALFVDPDFERQGIGRQLHDTMVGDVCASGGTQLSLSTDPDTRAEKFYRSAGWQESGRNSIGEVLFRLDKHRWLGQGTHDASGGGC
jgi:ribosomal protein S18 acetylase RimI-like enzyme